MKGNRLAVYIVLAMTAFFCRPVHAQTPRISALVPAGARVGTTVDVAIKGGGLAGARSVLVTGAPGVAATLTGSAANVDQSARPVFQSRCTTCHEARSPANRSMSPDQWAATVDRMITQRGAEIPAADKTRIVGYLRALARAGEMKVSVRVAADAAPGVRELRVLTSDGASTAYSFEIGTLPEVTAQSAANDSPDTAQNLTLPVVINGVITGSGQRQFFRFDAKKDQHLTFSLKAYRLNEECAAFFNPAIYIYDAAGREVGKDLGRYGIDPVIDWTAPSDGTYTLLVHDLIWKGSPSSVYRLAIGAMPEGGELSPAVASAGTSLAVRMMPSSDVASDPSGAFSIRVPEGASGVTMVDTPMGEAPMLVRDLPDGGEPNTASVVGLPALFRGLIMQPGQTDTFHVHARRGGGSLEVYARRLGSPLRSLVTVTNVKGKVVASRLAAGDDDLRIQNAFPNAGEYTVAVSDADGNGGPGFSYCWESRDGTPDYQLTFTPDVLNLAPGSTSALTVHLLRKENLRGPVTVSVHGLPPGVTAGTAILLPNATDTVLSVTAAPTAAVAASSITVEGTTSDVAVGAGETGAPANQVLRRARPLEVYRVNNIQQYISRGSGVVAVGSDAAPFSVSVTGGAESGVVALLPGGEAKLTVHVARQTGFKSDVQLLVMGLPPGITGPNVVNVKANQTDATVTLRASGDAKFLTDKINPATTPRFMIGGYPGGGSTGSFDGAPVCATAPLSFVSK